jgi:hypothetical protein
MAARQLIFHPARHEKVRSLGCPTVESAISKAHHSRVLRQQLGSNLSAIQHLQCSADELNFRTLSDSKELTDLQSYPMRMGNKGLAVDGMD